MMTRQNDFYLRIKDSYQVHLWTYPGKNKAVIASADKGYAEYVSIALGKFLRMMDGLTAFSDISRYTADKYGLTLSQSRTLINTIVEKFVKEGIIEKGTRKFRKREFPAPVTSPFRLSILQLQLTNKCNLNCIHCYAGSGGKMDKGLPTDKIINLITEFSALGGCRIFLTGGEPLLRQDIYEIIAHAKKCHLFVYLSTNGFAVNGKTAEKLVKYGVGAVNVSVDSSEAATHDLFRGKKNSFRKALNAIDLFLSLGIPCASQTTLFKDNLHQGADIVNMLRPKGVKSCYFVRMMPQGRAGENQDKIPDMEEYEKSRYDEYRNRRVKYGDNVYINLKKDNKVRCSAATSQLYVNSKGECYPCPSLECNELFFGKYPELALNEIWNTNNQQIDELRHFDLKKLLKCTKCEHFSFCKGGCAGNALQTTGSWRNPDPHFCVTMSVRKKVQELPVNCEA